MQRIYRRKPMQKCDFNKAALEIYLIFSEHLFCRTNVAVTFCVDLNMTCKVKEVWNIYLVWNRYHRCFWHSGVTIDMDTSSKSTTLQTHCLVFPNWRLFAKSNLQSSIYCVWRWTTNPFLLPRLADNWESLSEESGSLWGVHLLSGWLITNTEEEENNESSSKKKSKKYTWVTRFLVT